MRALNRSDRGVSASVRYRRSEDTVIDLNLFSKSLWDPDVFRVAWVQLIGLRICDCELATQKSRNIQPAEPETVALHRNRNRILKT